MKLLVLTLEFSCGTFSGNGIYCRSQVRALASLGHDLLVIAGRPHDAPDADSAPTEGARQLVQVPLPVWNRLDSQSSWQAFARACSQPHIVQAVVDFGPAFVLGIDWSSLPPYQALQAALQAQGTRCAPFVYMNYRVYERSAADEQEAAFYRKWEGEATRGAVLSTALSGSDASHLQTHLQESSHDVMVLLPALRSDMEALPLPADLQAAGARQRVYLTCCVRLSPEKQPERFVDLVAALQRRGTFAATGRPAIVSSFQTLRFAYIANAPTGTTPLMIGSAATAYAEGLKQRLREVCGAAVVEQRFLGPCELAELYARTALNVHPPLYDAYGMTIVEAASQGAPSVVQAGGSVGATDLLRGTEDEVVLLELGKDVDEVAQQVDALLRDPARLARVGRRACARARGWTEEANARALVAALDALGNV